MASKSLKIILHKTSPAFETISTYGATDNLYILMRLQGYLMPEKFKLIYILYASFVIGSATIYLPFGFTKPFFEAENLTQDLSAFFSTLQVAFNVYGGSSKILYLGLMLKKLHSTKALIAKLDERCKDSDEINEQNKIIQLGRKIVIIFVSVYFSYSIISCIGAVMNGRPPYSLYLPYINWRNSRLEFWIAAMFEYFMMNMACIQQALNDTYATVYVCLLLAHVRILKLRISKLGSKTELSESENVEALKMCIKDHKTLIEFKQIIKPIISVTVFIQFSITAIMMGITLINVTLFSTDFSTRLGSYAYFMAISLQTFPLCYFAQCLQFESAEISNQIFHSQWINQNSEYRKMLIFFMQRSQCLISFTAGKLVPITLGSFLSIVKFSFSLYTLIKKMDIKTKLGLE